MNRWKKIHEMNQNQYVEKKRVPEMTGRDRDENVEM